MRSSIHILSLVLVCGLLGAQSAAQNPAAGSGQGLLSRLKIPRVSRPPKLDDFLKGTPREAEATVTEFRQRAPGDGTPVSQPTTAYLSYDDKNLYVVFVCKDQPGKVRARLAKREDIGSDDQVAVYLDTFHDHRRAYVFATNPHGIQLDGILTEGQGRDFSFDTLWHSEGQVSADGFVVWMAIPFKSLRFPNSATQSWGIALGRFVLRNNEDSFWPHISLRVEGFTQQMAALEGLERISPGRNVQLIPYGLFTRARFLDTLDPRNPLFRIDKEFRGGLDAKIVARDALTFDIALNPDFSQVESDEPQVTINQRFEVFFPEKRPFFIENAGFFRTPLNLFFSRRIANPQFGGRMTGKLDRWALGVLAIDDRAPGRVRLASDPLRDERTGIGAVRVEREFAEQSKVGLFAGSRDFASSFNRVFSLDMRLKLSPTWVLTGQAVRSYTKQLPPPNAPSCQKAGERLSGPAYYAELAHFDRHFGYVGRYADRSPDFCSQLGFIPRVDIRQTEQFVRYTWRPQNRRVLSYGPSAFTVVNWNRQGRVQDWFVDARFNADFRGQTSLEVRRIETFELFQNIRFRKHRTASGFSTEVLKWLSFFADYSVGSNVNFFPASGLRPFLANVTNADGGFTLRPAPRIRFDQTYIYSRLSTRAGSTPAPFATGPSIFNNHILRSKLNYQFNRELSLRAILDYNAVLPNNQLVALPRSKRLAADLLLTYLLNPGTAFYLGYTDGYENLALDPGAPPTLRRTGSPTTSTGRQFFVKMSYLFRF